MKYSENIAILMSRFMATWKFIVILFAGIGGYIWFGGILANEKPLDDFNLAVSLLTLFIDLIILQAAINFRDMDRKYFEKGMKLDRDILKEIKENKDGHKQKNYTSKGLGRKQ